MALLDSKRFALALCAILVIAAAPRTAPPGRVVALTTQPGSALEHDAASLVAEDIAAAHHAHEVPVMLVGSAHLAVHGGRAALFVQVQSASLCGSAGCSTSVFVENAPHAWKRVLDSVSGPVKVSPRVHDGMHDLLVHGTDRWVWTGSAYADTLPAPGAPLSNNAN